MKVIVSGSRRVTDMIYVYKNLLINPYFSEFSEIIEGGAAGVDTLARYFARDNGIPHRQFKADWMTYGNKAGPIRNQEMLGYVLTQSATPRAILIAIPDSASKGTYDMITRAKNAGLEVFEYMYVTA